MSNSTQPDWSEAPEDARWWHEIRQSYVKREVGVLYEWLPSTRKWAMLPSNYQIVTCNFIPCPQPEQEWLDIPDFLRNQDSLKAEQWENGVPPIGAECHVFGDMDELGDRLKDFEGRDVTVIGHFEDTAGKTGVVIKHPALGVGCGWMPSAWLTPIRSPRDRAIDSASELIASMFTPSSPREIAERLSGAGLLREAK